MLIYYKTTLISVKSRINMGVRTVLSVLFHMFEMFHNEKKSLKT